MNFKHQHSCVEGDIVEKAGDTLSPYIEHLKKVTQDGYQHDESSLALPFDDGLQQEIADVIQAKKTPSLKYIILAGIGGSHLGTKAVYDALYGYFDALDASRYPKILFADTNDPEYLSRLTHLLQDDVSSPDEVLLNIISKSGHTTETLVNASLIIDVLLEKFDNAYERVVVTTAENSALWEAGREQGAMLLRVPDVSGRYSIFSSVGLFPLGMAGINTKELIRGAREVVSQTLSENISDNTPLVSAASIVEHAKEGRTIHNSFFFHPELESLGKWYAQLVAESLGKEKDKEGKVVHAGITPLTSLGSTDLHSMLQLFLAGPDDKITTFIFSESPKISSEKISDNTFSQLVGNISGKTPESIMAAILSAVKKAYSEKNRPFMEISLSEISEFTLGQFLQFKMIEVMYAGYLLNINTFNQPNVEGYKSETKKLLE